jgi:hypothetical protein
MRAMTSLTEQLIPDTIFDAFLPDLFDLQAKAIRIDDGEHPPLVGVVDYIDVYDGEHCRVVAIHVQGSERALLISEAVLYDVSWDQGASDDQPYTCSIIGGNDELIEIEVAR